MSIIDNKLHRIRYVEGNETLLNEDTRVLIVKAAVTAVILPDVAESKGLIFTVRNVIAPNSTMAVTRAGSDEILYNGIVTTIAINAQHGYVILISSGTYWIVFGAEGVA